MGRLTHLRRLELQLWANRFANEPGCELPEDWPDHWRLGHPWMAPTYCGDHAPGFIGLYAIINGLALLLAEADPLLPTEKKMLLDLGWKFLADRGQPAPWKGIRINTIERLTEAMAFALSRRRKQWIRSDRVSVQDYDEKALFLTLERMIVARRVVLILLGRSHYTVLRGFTPASWLLFDCTGKYWLKRRHDRAAALKPLRAPKLAFALSLSRLT